MRNLGLLALFVVVVAAWSAFAPGPPSDRPESFAPRLSGAGRVAIVHTETLVRPDELPADAPWPFPGSSVVLACAPSGWSVVRVAGRYAALNGHTSGQADRYAVEEAGGDRRSITPARDNAAFRAAGIVTAGASDAAIGTWWGALNARLSRRCG